MEENLVNEIVKNKAKELFVKNGADLSKDNNIAALITAAAGMSKVTEIVSSDIVIEELLELYGKNENEDVKSLIGMGPQYVKQNIGYSIDFNDYSASLNAYNTEKENYDFLYKELKSMNDVKNMNKSINI